MIFNDFRRFLKIRFYYYSGKRCRLVMPWLQTYHIPSIIPTSPSKIVNRNQIDVHQFNAKCVQETINCWLVYLLATMTINVSLFIPLWYRYRCGSVMTTIVKINISIKFSTNDDQKIYQHHAPVSHCWHLTSVKMPLVTVITIRSSTIHQSTV